ncbi:MAG: transcriptional regulator [Chitinophagaceae bacterium]|nr:transcriptional regulator [Chitinophagaceae bacterium]
MKKILLIEDNSDVRENIAEILELANYKVVTAENGKIGVDLAKKENPDLIICDVMMPELDGFGVLHVLSKNSDTSSIPFIFLTAKAEKDDMRKGMNLGADDYLTKPFDDLELLDAVEIRLKKNLILKETFQKNTEGLKEFIDQAKGLKELESLTSNDNRNQSIPKKHNIYSEGSYPNFLYFINKGKVKTFKTDKLGNEFITGLHAEGDFLGYIDLLENSAYSDSALAMEDTEVCTIKREDFFALIYNNRDIANKFIKMLSDNVIEREERLLKLAYQSVRKRVAEALMQLQNKYKQEGHEAFSMAISRDDLSGLVGASKETVIRMLSDFKEEGLIQVNGSRITLLKPDKLMNLKN